MSVRDSRRAAALQSALQFVSTTSDVPSEHKLVLIEVLTQAMRDDESAELAGARSRKPARNGRSTKSRT